MNRRYFLAASLAAVLGIMTGCGQTETPPPPPTVGVADMEQLTHAHHRYSDYFRLEQEYHNLLAEYDAERADLIARSAAAQEALAAKISSPAWAAALDEEFRARVTVRQEEWNARLEARWNEWRQKEQARISDPELPPDLEAVNLQLKLRSLPLDAPTRAEMEARLAELLAARGGTEWDASLSAEAQADLTALREQAQADLDQYAAAVHAELEAKRDEMAAQMTRDVEMSLLPAGDEWQAKWRSRLQQKETELTALREAMRADIARTAAQIATEKGLEIVFSEYRANLGAVDITADITARMATSSQGGTEREQ